MKVSFVADSDAFGGAEIWLLHHVRRAAEHGVLASVVAADPVAARFGQHVPDDRFAVVPLARHADVAPDTAAALAAQRPEVVLVNLVDPASNRAVVEAALGVAPTVAVLHLAGSTGEGAGRRRLAGTFSRLAAGIGTASAAAAQIRDEVARFGLPEPAHGVVVSVNGVDIPPEPSGPAGRVPPRVGAFGRLTAQKGFDVLLEAVRLLVARGVPFDLVLGGAGRDEATLRQRAAGLPVTFTGFVTDPYGFLVGVDVFCLSSRHEALPLALLEAMAAGLPCVATDVGDIAARVRSAVSLVPPEDPVEMADALQPLLEDAGLRDRSGRAARALAVDHHDASHMVASTYDLLRRTRRS